MHFVTGDGLGILTSFRHCLKVVNGTTVAIEEEVKSTLRNEMKSSFVFCTDFNFVKIFVLFVSFIVATTLETYALQSQWHLRLHQQALPTLNLTS